MDLIVDVNCRNSVGATPLFEAISQSSFETTQYLLDNGADANATNIYDDTPLSTACVIGDLKIVKLLHEYGADVSRKDNRGFTPLMCAAMVNRIDIVKYLVVTTEISTKNKTGKTAIDMSYGSTREFLVSCSVTNTKYIAEFSNNLFSFVELVN